jgi:hypothetical protein
MLHIFDRKAINHPRQDLLTETSILLKDYLRVHLSTNPFRIVVMYVSLVIVSSPVSLRSLMHFPALGRAYCVRGAGEGFLPHSPAFGRIRAFIDAAVAGLHYA